MPTPDRYPHDFRTADHGDTYRCEHCGVIDPDDGTESECPVPLRAEVDRLTAERDRAAQIRAVEGGDAGNAPVGWERWGALWTRRYPDTAHGSVCRHDNGWLWLLTDTDRDKSARARSALEAMEAADKAHASGVTRG